MTPQRAWTWVWRAVYGPATLLATFLALCCAPVTQANLAVKVEGTKKVGSKTVLKLSMKNTFKEKIESARAQVVLLNDEGKVVGQGVQWVIGGGKGRPPLAPDATTTFNFVVSTERPYAKTKVTYTRIVLEGGKAGDLKMIDISE